MKTNHFGKTLTAAREYSGISQYNLGIKLGYKSGQLISNVERGEQRFPLKKVKKLSKIVGIDLSTFAIALAKDNFEEINQFLGLS